MYSDIAIKVDGLGKCHQIYANPKDRLKQGLFGRYKQYYNEFWSLRNCSFNVNKGETVGVIGRNGSGKSTLLQLICGTLSPSSGAVYAEGRIAALLELGAGFNLEFTGRENVYMNAAILGLAQNEIDTKFDEIVEFSGIGDFIDQPVKIYSSGMYLRLAFSVAINIDPDILVVDEALSVGDNVFQHKCISRFEQIVSNGTSILFVSHDLSMIRAHCKRAIWLEDGEVKAIGKASDVADRYYQSTIEESLINDKNLRPEINQICSTDNIEDGLVHNEWSPLYEVNASTRWGSKEIEIIEWALCDEDGRFCNEFHFKDKLKLIIRLRANEYIPICFPGFLFRDVKGNFLTGITTRTCEYECKDISPGNEIKLTFTSDLLYAAGNYTVMLNIACDEKGYNFYDVCENVGNFSILEDPPSYLRYGYAMMYLPTTLEVDQKSF